MLKGSNSYRNGSLSLSTPHRVRWHRSLTSAKRENERESTHVYEKVKVHITSFTYRAFGVTKFKTTKINSEDPRQLFTKICTPENYPLYGILHTLQAENQRAICRSKLRNIAGKRVLEQEIGIVEIGTCWKIYLLVLLYCV